MIDKKHKNIDNFDNLDNDSINNLDKDSISNLDNDSINNIGKDSISNLDNETLDNLDILDNDDLHNIERVLSNDKDTDVLKALFNDIELDEPSPIFCQNVMDTISEIELETVKKEKATLLKQVVVTLTSFLLLLCSLGFIFRNQIKNFFIIYILPIINNIFKYIIDILGKTNLNININIVTLIDFLFIGGIITFLFVVAFLYEKDKMQTKEQTIL